MYTPDKYIIDNFDLKLYEELKKLIADNDELDIATGFFNLGAFGLVADELENIRKFRMLLGKSPAIGHTEEHDIFEYFSEQLAKSVEDEDFEKKNEDTNERLIAFLEDDNVEVRLYKKSFLHGKAYMFPSIAVVGSSNFTYAGLGGESDQGLSSNTELNMVENKGIDYLRDTWFERLWSDEFTVPKPEGLTLL